MKVACLHGELDKLQRQAVLSKFVAGQYRALVRTAHYMPSCPIAESPCDCATTSPQYWCSIDADRQ